MNYFAYGSNMSASQMQSRCPDSRLIGRAVLRDYMLDFTISAPERWQGGGCADVVRRTGSEVWGLLYSVTEADLKSLDEAEGPRYRRTPLSVKDENGGNVMAQVYEVIGKAPSKPPSATYLNRIKSAAADYSFPVAYRSFLDSIPTQI